MINIIDHLILQEKLTLIRREGIDKIHFRSGMIEIGRFIGYHFADTLEKEEIEVKTPLGMASGIRIKVKKILLL